jgi:hypothetical protein
MIQFIHELNPKGTPNNFAVEAATGTQVLLVKASLLKRIHLDLNALHNIATQVGTAEIPFAETDTPNGNR